MFDLVGIIPYSCSVYGVLQFLTPLSITIHITLSFVKYHEFSFSIVHLCIYKNKIEEIKYRASESTNEEENNVRNCLIFMRKKCLIAVLGIFILFCIKKIVIIRYVIVTVKNSNQEKR